MPWTTISTNSELTAIHAALLPTEPDGVIFYYGDWAAATGGNAQVQELTFSRLYRIASDTIENFPDDALPTTDCFCGGQAFLTDGRLLSAGGTFGWAKEHEGIHEPHYDGERGCWLYLPRAKRWQRVADLNFQPDSDSIGGGRWYPTLVTLGNGEVFAVGGHPMANDFYPPSPPDAQRHNNNRSERYSVGSDKWTLMTADVTAPDLTETDSYPRFRLMPDGLLFSDTAGKGGSKRLFNPYQGVWTGPDIGNLGGLPGFYSRGSAASSVLLPLLPPLYKPRILVTNSPDPTAFRIDVDGNKTWEATTPRTGTAAGRDRTNACTTLLPTGQVLVTGGWPGNYGADNDSLATLEPELYTPGIDWAAGDFSNTNEEEWETLADPAPTRRGYHSGALLLPDGRVWHGGSTTVGDGANRNFEIFSPPYVSAAGRPTITSCPDHIGYLMPFYVATPNANSIERVALMRCGSITHGFDADQRCVGLQFNAFSNGALEIHAPHDANIAPPGYYMLFLIDNQGRVCQRASFIRLSQQKLLVSADISTYSIYEVDALGPPSDFENALYVVFDGFMPHEIEPIEHRLFMPNGEDIPDVEVTYGAPSYEAGSDKADVAQRIAYPVHLRFTSTDAFDQIPDNEDFLTCTFRATAGLFQADTKIRLSKKQNPRMRDGEPPWLSIDLKVYKTHPGLSPLMGIEHPLPGAANAYQYINDVITALNDPDEDGFAQFEALPLDQESTRLELGINDANGTPTFNYALARVRFIAPEGVNAVNVRTFFRLWTTGWSDLEFDTNGSYRRHGDGSNATPLLGIQGGEIGNIPCFAQARNPDMEEQDDAANRRTLEGADETEVFGYFGCWLDVNQDAPLFPLKPQSNGPFDDDDDPQGLRTIQQLMRGLHQCLIAEIHYTPDPILPNDTPGSSDNLAQRNILFDDSDNPGGFAAHLVHHTFELKPSPVSFDQTVHAPHRFAVSASRRLHPDELVIDWGDLPRESLVTFYMPQVDAREIVRAGAARQSAGNLLAAGPDVLRCKVSDVGFIPIPGPLSQTIAGLMTVQLPPGVPYGKSYRVVLRQVSGRTFKVLGTTEFRIQVKEAEELLPGFIHKLAVLKHIALSIPEDNRWYPVFQRYLAELGDRVRAFGGDPEAVRPNPHGTGGRPGGDGDGRDEGTRLCATGEVTALHYGCCGGLEGFTLSDCDEEWRFDCVRPCLEKVLLTAMREGLKAHVHARQDRKLDRAINRSCPWSGQPISADALTSYRGRTVGFCSPAHRDRFATAIATFEGPSGREALPKGRPAPPPPAQPAQPARPAEPAKPPTHDSPADRHEMVAADETKASEPAAAPERGKKSKAQPAAAAQVPVRVEVPAPPAPAPAATPAPAPAAALVTPTARTAGPAANAACPWSGNPVKESALTTYRGRTVGFCDPRHRDAFGKAIRMFDERIDCPDKCDGSQLIVERIDLQR